MHIDNLIPWIYSLDYLLVRMWEYLGLVKVYTKKRGAHPDLSDPICLRTGATIEVRMHFGGLKANGDYEEVH